MGIRFIDNRRKQALSPFKTLNQHSTFCLDQQMKNTFRVDQQMKQGLRFYQRIEVKFKLGCRDEETEEDGRRGDWAAWWHQSRRVCSDKTTPQKLSWEHQPQTHITEIMMVGWPNTPLRLEMFGIQRSLSQAADVKVV